MTGELESTVAELARQIEHRYHGKYRGLVVDNQDPDGLGRLRVRVPSVFGDELVTGWALPCVPYGGQADQGWFALPDTGAGVWVEFEEGDLEFPVWVGTYWSKPGQRSEVPRPNDRDGAPSAGSDGPPPTRRILKTARGHTIQIEDAAGQDMILIHEATHGHTMVLDGDGITISHGGGSFLTMTGDAVTLHAAAKLTLDAPGQDVEIKANSVAFNKG